MSKPFFAFFDVDNTLIRLKSMFSFHDYWHGEWRGKTNSMVREEGADIIGIIRSLERNGVSREIINRRFFEFFAGRNPDEVSECAKMWFLEMRVRENVFIQETLEMLSELRMRGGEPVFVSGSLAEIVAPIASALNVRYVLANRLGVHNGKFTGKLLFPQTIGAGKRQAVDSFLADSSVDPADCWAFGDDRSDLPMLEAVGHPVVIPGDEQLEAEAGIRNWLILKSQPADLSPVPLTSSHAFIEGSTIIVAPTKVEASPA